MFNTSNPEYSSYIYRSRYAKWRDDLGRREEWEETVARYMIFFQEHLEAKCGYKMPRELFREVYKTIQNLEVMPSMRCLMTAGPALAKSPVAGYNCAFLAIDHPSSFDELMFILMNGTGVGFSVEKKYIDKLPTVAEEFHETDSTIIIPDSRVGWASSYRELIGMLYGGRLPKYDFSKIRAAGARLKTFGGRASGPEPLENLFKFTAEIFKTAAGRKLTSIECHDIATKCAEVVVVGGVRRSALISLSDLNDDLMRKAKSGQWWLTNGQRALANNSACYSDKPDIGTFLNEWTGLYESKSGERGIYNRAGAKRQASLSGRRDTSFDFGLNPCAEILLRSRGLCNLAESVARPGDSLDDLCRKVRISIACCSWQCTLTDFKYLGREWRRNAEEERLLGASITGIMDHPVLNGSEGIEKLKEWLSTMKAVALEETGVWSKKLNIPFSAAVTTIKPSGTVSQLCDTSSGIHARHAPYYIRTVRADKKDPLAQFMAERGFPVEEDVTNPHNWVFSFPIKSPEGSITRSDRSAIKQLEFWKIYKENWTEHNVSVTVTVKENEWLDVGAWVYKHFDDILGISFLPDQGNHVYRQQPYSDCTEQEYEELKSRMPVVDWSEFKEEEDNTTASREQSCSAGQCEL